jgi:thiamine biosynthesis lipoprotein ApbE
MKNQRIKIRKKVGTSTYIQRTNTLERKLLKQVKELDDIMKNIQKRNEIRKITKNNRKT